MKAHQADFPVSVMAEVLRVSGSGFYAWLDRAPSSRAQHDTELAEVIRSSPAASDGAYGALRIHADLKDEGVRVGKKRVARLMREHGIAGVSRRRGPRTTTRKAGGPKGPDLVQREFVADRPNALWVADPAPPRRAGTYVPTGSGWLYLAVVLDVFSRRIVGWAMAGHLRTELVLAALDMAIDQRKPTGVVHHSDHGCQYTSLAFGARCKEAGVRPSLGSIGDCFDNAMCESFFATLECELLDRRRFAKKAEARMALFHFIEAWYGRADARPPRRRHSALGYDSPVMHERKHHEALAASYS